MWYIIGLIVFIVALLCIYREGAGLALIAYPVVLGFAAIYLFYSDLIGMPMTWPWIIAVLGVLTAGGFIHRILWFAFRTSAVPNLMKKIFGDYSPKPQAAKIKNYATPDAVLKERERIIKEYDKRQLAYEAQQAAIAKAALVVQPSVQSVPVRPAVKARPAYRVRHKADRTPPSNGTLVYPPPVE